MVGGGKSLGTRLGHKMTFIIPFVKCSTIHTVMNWNETMEVLVSFPDHLYSPHSDELAMRS